MNWNQINGILRAVLPAALAYAVGKGYLTDGAAADVSAAVIAVAAAIWSVVTNKPKQ